jgi:hypothetical protein
MCCARRQAVNKYQRELSQMFKDCVAKGGFTKEAATYYDTYGILEAGTGRS